MYKKVTGTQQVPPVTTTYTLTSYGANERFNGDRLSRVSFYIPGFYRNTQHTSFATVRVVRAIIPNTTLTVDIPYNVLQLTVENSVSNYSLQPSDYTPLQFGQLVASYLPNGTVSLTNYQYTFSSTKAFSFGRNTTCYSQLGMGQDSTVDSVPDVGPTSTIYVAHMPYQYDFSLPESYYIRSDPVLNFALNTKTKQKFFWQIVNTAPNEDLVNYENNTATVCMLQPDNNIDNILIEITDVNGSYIDFHGVEWTIVLEVSEYLDFFDTAEPGNSSLFTDPLLIPTTLGNSLNFEQSRKRKFFG